MQQGNDNTTGRHWVCWKSNRVQVWQRVSFGTTSANDGLECLLPYTLSQLLNVQITAKHSTNGTSLNVSSTYWYITDIVRYSVRSPEGQSSINGASCYVEYIRTI